jgi:predicted enzyme related to lactoylglutathione lyase
MPEMTKYAPGMFCWSDFGSHDLPKAKKFYTGLFGWTGQDDPMPEGGAYTRLLKDGRDVCGLFAQRPEMKHIPPFWSSYIAVENVDAVAAKVEKLGGKLAMPAFDVMDVGRMVAVQDPTGATLCLWQAKKHFGARVFGEPNALCWTELMTSNVDIAGKFYTNLLGWQAEPYPGNEYTLFKAGGQPTAGMMGLTAEMKGVPPHWNIYFAVTNPDEIVKKAGTLGGRTQVPPTDIPTVGRFAMIADPEGAVFGVLQPLPRS